MLLNLHKIAQNMQIRQIGRTKVFPEENLWQE
jgi:hypothetical protein